MEKVVQQIYPPPARKIALKNLYLSHDLRNMAASTGQSFVYANFVTSLDGRIAVSNSASRDLTVPKNVANDRDWRLFQELAAQADIIISSGRYLRDLAAGKAQEILQTDDPRFADLSQWRIHNGLSPHPDIAILSNSLEFPIPNELTAGNRNVLVFTAGLPDPQRVRVIEAKAGRVIVAGDQAIDGREMVEQLQKLGYQMIYSAAGPKVLHTLLEADVLDRLYITTTNRILGGESFATIMDGPLLTPTPSLELGTIYFDSDGPDGLSQLFVSYNRELTERNEGS
jgi:riboflavin biosynthesis pyrimidine reductase